MDHLFSSLVRVEALSQVVNDGIPSMQWRTVPGLAAVPCRLDLSFLRPGKDQVQLMENGRAPDRIGVMFTKVNPKLRPDQRIIAIPNRFGQIVVPGTFEIRNIPDVAIDYRSGHHIEVQIIETIQDIPQQS